MRSVFLIYNDRYSIEIGGRFSSTMDLDKGKKIHDKLVEEGLADGKSWEIHYQFIAEVLRKGKTGAASPSNQG